MPLIASHPKQLYRERTTGLHFPIAYFIESRHMLGNNAARGRVLSREETEELKKTTARPY